MSIQPLEKKQFAIFSLNDIKQIVGGGFWSVGYPKSTGNFTTKLIKRSEDVNELFSDFLDNYFLYNHSAGERYIFIMTDYDPVLLGTEQVLNCNQYSLYMHIRTNHDVYMKQFIPLSNLLSEDNRSKLYKRIKHFNEGQKMDSKNLEKITGIKIYDKRCICKIENPYKRVEAIQKYVYM